MSVPDSVTPRWQRRPEERPEEILSAALEVFGDAGFARAKLDDVARRAGVSKGTLYLYFDSKDELFRAVVRSWIVAVVADAEAAAEAHEGSCRSLFEAIMARMWRAARMPEGVRVIRLVHAELAHFPELSRFYLDEVVLRARRLLERVVERGIERGEFRPEARRIVPRVVPLLFVHAAQTQALFAPIDPNALADDELLAGMIDLVLYGSLASSTRKDAR